MSSAGTGMGLASAFTFARAPECRFVRAIPFIVPPVWSRIAASPEKGGRQVLCLKDADLTGHNDDTKDTGGQEKAGTPWSYCRVVPYRPDGQPGDDPLGSGAQKGQHP